MKTYAILVSLMVIGLVITLVCTLMPGEQWYSVWLVQVAAMLFIGGGVGVIDKTFLHRDHFRQTSILFSIHKSITSLGLEEVFSSASNHSYNLLIRKSRVLSIVVNDGRTWISSRVPDFQERFSNKGFLTELFVTDPMADAARILAQKTGYTLEEQKSKIKHAKQRLVEEFLAKGKNGILKIYHIPYLPTHSVFLGSNKAFISFYGISSGRRAVPLFVLKKMSTLPSLFADVRDDLDKLRSESNCVFDSEKDTTLVG